jgi:hypothetical protein
MSGDVKDFTLEELREKDKTVACVECFAEVGEACRDVPWTHFSRRLRWLIAERRPDLVEPKS